MMANKFVKLTTPVEIFGKTVTEIELAEPHGATYFRLGDPRVPVMNASGSGYWVENPSVIQQYLHLLIKHEQAMALANLLSIQDSLALKAALFDFFSSAEAKLSEERSTSSSSTSAL